MTIRSDPVIFGLLASNRECGLTPDTLSSFEASLWNTLWLADGVNLDRLRAAFPAEADAVYSWRRERGFSDRIRSQWRREEAA